MSDKKILTGRAKTSRRDFVKRSTAAVAGAALAGELSIARSAHAAGDDLIKIALIGCGGRGRGAAIQALSNVSHGNAYYDFALRRNKAGLPQGVRPAVVLSMSCASYPLGTAAYTSGVAVVYLGSTATVTPDAANIVYWGGKMVSGEVQKQAALGVFCENRSIAATFDDCFNTYVQTIPVAGSGITAMRWATVGGGTRLQRAMESKRAVADLGYSSWMKAYGLVGIAWLLAFYITQVVMALKALRRSSGADRTLAQFALAYILFQAVSYFTLNHLMTPSGILLDVFNAALIVRLYEKTRHAAAGEEAREQAARPLLEETPGLPAP